MSVLNKIAHFQGRRDEVPNQELARELVEQKNRDGIAEIAANLWNKDKNIQSDCLKVIYEIGYLDPELVAEYAGDFLKLLKSKSNRLAWGSMIALSTIASIAADVLNPYVEEIKKVMAAGSVITVDNGIKTLSAIAASAPERNQKIFPYLLQQLASCRPKDVPQHAEKIVMAVNRANKNDFIKVLEKRSQDLMGPQLVRIKRVIKRAEEIFAE